MIRPYKIINMLTVERKLLCNEKCLVVYNIEYTTFCGWKI